MGPTSVGDLVDPECVVAKVGHLMTHGEQGSLILI
jgi:hypothetical protein